MTTPGVGPVVALTDRATVDVPARFRNSKAVGAVFGLTCSKYQSGEIDRGGRISRCGDEMMRVMLYEAAQSMLRSKKWPWLPSIPKCASPSGRQFGRRCLSGIGRERRLGRWVQCLITRRSRDVHRAYDFGRRPVLLCRVGAIGTKCRSRQRDCTQFGSAQTPTSCGPDTGLALLQPVLAW